MKKAVFARCTMVGGFLLALVITAPAGGVTPGQSGPGVKVRAAVPVSSTTTADKQKKLNDDLAQAAKCFRGANFEQAVEWYKSALQLEPASDEIMTHLHEASSMRTQQEQARQGVPTDAKARKQFLTTIYNEADAYYGRQEYDKANKAFSKIWMIEGDYNNKTVTRLEESARMMQQKGQSGAVRVPVAAVTLSNSGAKTVAPVVPVVEAAPPVAAPAPAVDPRIAAAKATAAIMDDPPAQASTPAQPLAITPVSYEQPAPGALAAKPASAQPAKMVAAAMPAAVEADAASIDDLTRLQVVRLLKTATDQNAAGKAEEARTTVKKALELWPSNSQAKTMLQNLNAQLGNTPRDEVDALLSEGDGLAADQKYDEALARYDEALKKSPGNPDAMMRKSRVMKIKVKTDTLTDIKQGQTRKHEIDQMHTMALKALEAKDLKTARETWQKILEQDPTNQAAQVYLDQTKDAWARQSADSAMRKDAEQHSEKMETLLNYPVSIQTSSRIPLQEFMEKLSYCTPDVLEFTITAGADTNVFGNFQNKSVRDILDTVLMPVGLSWSVNSKNMIVIDQKLLPKTYSLSPEQMGQVKSLLANGELFKDIWNQTEPPSKGCSITVDERQNILMLTGSALHIQRMDSLLGSIKGTAAQEMTMRIYKINEKDAGRIKSMISSLIASSSAGTPFDLERKIFTDKDDLIIRDTPENIKKIEDLLLDQKFIQNIKNEKLDIQNFSLIPRDTETISDEIRAFTGRVKEAIEVFLYSKEGVDKANEEGRRMWFDPYTLQLTIVDTPTNLARVGQYIESLPEISQKTRQDVIFPTYAVAQDLAGSLLRIMDITNGSGAGGAGGGQDNGNEVVFQLNQGQERSWRNMRIRVIRLTDPNKNNRGGGPQRLHEGSVQFTIDTGYDTQDMTQQELTTRYMQDYRITIEQVNAQTGDTGGGNARFRISYVPQGLRNQMSALQGQYNPNMPDPMAAMNQGGAQGGQAQTTTLQDNGISITPVAELNALIVRYTDPQMYKDVLDLVAQLDKPMKQVSIETKFVEVNETRAKEFSADFNVAGLGTDPSGKQKSIDWSTQKINTGFAQDSSEFRDIFGPPLENSISQSLLKGTTVLNAVIGSGDPLLNISLRFFEAEGVINVVNGPKVTSLDGQQATFRVESLAATGAGATVPTINNNGLQVAFQPFAPPQNNIQMANPDVGGGGGGGANLINGVYLSVTPEIPSENSIILNNLEAEILDYDGFLNDVAAMSFTGAGAAGGAVATRPGAVQTVFPTETSVNFTNSMMIKHKHILTNARVTNGGTIVLGGWTGERTQEATSGVPILRNMPYIGKLLFSRNQRSNDRTTLLVFLTCNLVE